jgi:preprotein translocase subunit SecB
VQAPETGTFQVESIFPVTLIAQRFPVALPEPQHVHMTFQAQIEVTQPTQCQATLTAKAEMEKNQAFAITVTYVGIFTFQPSDDARIEDGIKAWDQHLISALLPAVREAFLELSVRLRLPPLLIPLIKPEDLTRSVTHSPSESANTRTTEASSLDMPQKRSRRKKPTPTE